MIGEFESEVYMSLKLNSKCYAWCARYVCEWWMLSGFVTLGTTYWH